MNYNDYFEANRQGWNKRTAVHKDSAFYDVASFKNGKTSLNNIELNELGDVKGKTLLHLQCHFGQDTLSWARAGAIVTGIDLSDNAIETAKQLSTEMKIPAEFICCNVYDTLQHTSQQYDIVFTSYGVVGWLPDLEKWAAVISGALKPGGIFYMVEFHPVVWMLDENFQYIRYYYHNEEVIADDQSGTYTDRDADIQYREYSCYNCFNNMVQGEDGYWRVNGLENKLPMMYSVKAVKAASV